MVDLGEVWRDYLWDIYLKGNQTQKDDGDEIKERLGVHLYLHQPQSLSLSNIPIDITTPKQFLNLVSKGIYDIDNYQIKGPALAEYISAWDKPEQIYLDDNSFVYTYPERLFNINLVDISSQQPIQINQYDVMIKRLSEHLGSNRAVATLYSAGLDRDEQHIPCLNFLQAIVRENKLILFCMFRSNDIFNAWPSNMFLLTYLGLKLASEFNNINFEGIDYHCSSAHYYMTEEPIIKKMYGW